MSDKTTNVNFNLGIFWVVVFLLAVTFCGQPDLHDKALQWADKELAKP